MMKKFLFGLLLAFLPLMAHAACPTLTVTAKDAAGSTQTFCVGGTSGNFISQVQVLDSAGTNALGVDSSGRITISNTAFALNAGSNAIGKVDPNTSANWGIGATGSGPPANSVYLGANGSGNLTGLVTCDNHIFKHITSATDTVAVQGVTAKTIKICGVLAWFAGTNTIYLENTASTNSNCSSTLTQITGAWSGVAQSVGGFNGPFWNGLANTSGNGLCINSNGSGGVDVDIFYTQGS